MNRVKINEIDWDNWQPEVSATLMFVVRGDSVLLIHKKRGLGAGKVNGPGGHIEVNEKPMACAIRETQEELCIATGNVKYMGELYFHAEDMPRIHAYVYTATTFEGEPTETDEAIPLWTKIAEIPYEKMWQDDQIWLPEVLRGNRVRAWFTFEQENLLDHRLEINPKITAVVGTEYSGSEYPAAAYL
jgi:8-oxo-dGTP diphosphatase